MNRLTSVFVSCIIMAALIIGGYFGLKKLYAIRISDDVTGQAQTKETSAVDYKVYRHWYNELSASEKKAYNNIYSAAFDQPEKIEVPQVSIDELEDVIKALCYDNPQLICLDKKVTLQSDGFRWYVYPEYRYDKAQCDAYLNQCMAAAKSLVSRASALTSDYDRELFLHDELVSDVTYSDVADSEDIIGGLVNHAAICEGYSVTMKMLLDMAGIDSCVITGSGINTDRQNEDHAWLVVKIGGRWYQLDPTWDDPVSGESSSGAPSHNYFNVTTYEISRTHSGFTLPDGISCSATEANYHIKEGLFSTSSQDTDSIITNKAAGAGTLEIKFSSPELLAQEKQRLIDAQGIYALYAAAGLTTVSTVSFSQSNDIYVLSVSPEIQ